MGYEELWKALADLLTELRRKDVTIPSEIMNNLRSAKTMIQILKVDPSHAKNLLKVEMYLGNLESRLLRMAQDTIAPQGIEQWMKKFEKARSNVYETKEVVESKFVQGLPRSEQWIRIQISEDRSQENIERMAEENELSY